MKSAPTSFSRLSIKTCIPSSMRRKSPQAHRVGCMCGHQPPEGATHNGAADWGSDWGCSNLKMSLKPSYTHAPGEAWRLDCRAAGLSFWTSCTALPPAHSSKDVLGDLFFSKGKVRFWELKMSFPTYLSSLKPQHLQSPEVTSLKIPLLPYSKNTESRNWSSSEVE